MKKLIAAICASTILLTACGTKEEIAEEADPVEETAVSTETIEVETPKLEISETGYIEGISLDQYSMETFMNLTDEEWIKAYKISEEEWMTALKFDTPSDEFTEEDYTKVKALVFYIVYGRTIDTYYRQQEYKQVILDKDATYVVYLEDGSRAFMTIDEMAQNDFILYNAPLSDYIKSLSDEEMRNYIIGYFTYFRDQIQEKLVSGYEAYTGDGSQGIELYNSYIESISNAEMDADLQSYLIQMKENILSEFANDYLTVTEYEAIYGPLE